jgi:hypothetical protein
VKNVHILFLGFLALYSVAVQYSRVFNKMAGRKDSFTEPLGYFCVVCNSYCDWRKLAILENKQEN